MGGDLKPSFALGFDLDFASGAFGWAAGPMEGVLSIFTMDGLLKDKFGRFGRVRCLVRY
jgi:hypothetical protein